MGDTSSSSTPATRVVLNMILGNEEAIIRRCLDSVRSIVDAYVLCVNGTDGTETLLHEYFAEHGLVACAHVCRHKWLDDFAANRNLALDEARRHVVDTLGWSSEHTYALLLDADMTLVTRPRGATAAIGDDDDDDASLTFDKTRDLTSHGYHLVQMTQTLAYPNVRLVRMSSHWVCEEPTHEAWNCKDPRVAPLTTLTTLWIDDRNDGGSKQRKFQRDCGIFERQLATRGSLTPRATFYLAQSYRDLARGTSDTDERRVLLLRAIDTYRKRIAMHLSPPPGQFVSFDDTWYSHYAMGMAFEQLDADNSDGVDANGWWPRALDAYLDAFGFNSSRAEPLLLVARHYRCARKYTLGLQFARMGLDVAPPSADGLFVERGVYEYELWREASICAFYTQERHTTGILATERVALCPTAVAHRAETIGNLAHYARRLTHASVVELTPSTPTPASTLSLHGPALLRSLDGTMLYALQQHTAAAAADAASTAEDERTLAWLLHLDSDTLEPRRRWRVVYDQAPIHGRITNLASAHLFWDRCGDDRMYATAQCAGTKDTSVFCRFARGPGVNGNEDEWRIESVTVRPGAMGVPFHDANNMAHLLHSFGPTIVLRPHIDAVSLPVGGGGGGVVVVECSRTEYQSLDFSSWIGSSQAIEWSSVRRGVNDVSTRLCVVRQPVDAAHSPCRPQRVCLHRFVLLSADGRHVLHFSPPFYLESLSLQTCGGLERSPSNPDTTLVLGVGAAVYTVDVSTVQKMLAESRPLSTYQASLY